jgi:uncharacterized cupin superfamily protein
MPQILTAHVDDPLDPMDLPPNDILAGDPQGRSKVLLHAQDGAGGFTGIFSSEPGAIRAQQPSNETFHVLKGQARVERSSGETVVLTAGDVAVLPPGEWTWTFETPFRAVFVAAPAPGHEG